MVEIVFIDDAIDDLRRMGPQAVPKVLKKLLILETSPEAGYPLGGDLTGFRKLVVGRNTWRIVYRIVDGLVEICEIWAVGARTDAEVYAAALTRVRTATRTEPHLVALVEIMERLGKLADGLEITVPPTVEPVPDWLAERLIYTARMPREQVAAMSLQEAVDRWTEYTARARSNDLEDR